MESPENQDYVSAAQAEARFKEILGSKPEWKHLVNSQTIEHLSRQVTWPFRQSLHQMERVKQESHISTALDRSSILAGAEDRQYVPRKPSPSRGIAAFANGGSIDVLIEAGSIWLSDDQLQYEVQEAVSVPAGSYATSEIAQVETITKLHTVTELTAYYEIRLDKSQSAKISSLRIEVDEGMGLLEWSLYPRLLNTNEHSRAFDEFYSSLDELGIRFGNGDFGRIPEMNATVKVTLKLTEGESELLPGQNLTFFGDSADPNIGMITAQTQTAITGGRAREGIEEIRNNAIYNVLYDNQLVWDDDYRFSIRRRWPEALWVNVWGEQEQEQVHGLNQAWINKIFISAYSPDNPDVLSEIVTGMEEPMNRAYIAVEPNLKPYHLIIHATVPRTVVRSTAELSIRERLEFAYGLNSPVRLEEIRLHDMYDLLNETGYFTGAGALLTIDIVGDINSNGLDDLVYLDVQGSTIQVQYG
ncbi:MAG: hypothetical protein OIF57_06630 [Marinobacterium sp.]|nr:hypothetical protein [Marinobacterium sp.]